MELDLFNNELTFKRVVKPTDFAKALQLGKGMKFRQRGNVFYVNLEHFDVARQVLRQFSAEMRVTIRYEKFAHLFVTNRSPIHIVWGPAECKITGAGMPWDSILPQTRYFDKAAFNSKAYENGAWDGNTNLFNVIDGKFPSGILEIVIGILNERGVPFTVERTFEYPKRRFELHPVFKFVPTDDQNTAVSVLAKSNTGIAKLPTGFGKTSVVAAKLIAEKGVRSMFLANQKVLISDARKDFLSVFRGDSIKIGMIGDGEFDPGDITVASIQGIVAALDPPSPQEISQADHEAKSILSRVNRAQDAQERAEIEEKVKKIQKRIDTLQYRRKRADILRPFLESVELFIVDESQVLGTQMWNKFLHACPAPYRYTLSATPTRADGGGIQIIAATGPIRFESSAADQIAKGRLAEYKGYFKRFDHKIPRSVAQDLRIDFHQAYRIFIMENEPRNRHLCEKVIEYAKSGFSVLAFVTRLDHAEIIQTTLLELGMPEWTMAIVTGETSKKVREDRIDRYRKGEFPVLIGSSIFDVGFNAEIAARGVRFNAGASEVREPQRAGRTVRVREDGSHGETYDVLDMNVPYFENQAWKRIKLLKDEFGKHRISILPGTIEGTLDVAALHEVVAAAPDETDRERGAQIIAQLQMLEHPEDIPQFEGIEEIENDPDLKSLLEELRFDGRI